ncbi:MAG TPA: DUF2272 domain-containing protein [Reyranella sp.]|nr:DUF2272 domain-containing protein [Reyranella sp.]
MVALRVLPVIGLLLLAACSERPQLTAAGLPQLGACPGSSFRPEAPPPSISAKASMVMLAEQEWQRFGRQTISYADGTAQVTHRGLNERQMSERVRDYWRSVDKPELSGLDTDVPWSAAFISWDIESAGVPREKFCPDERHTIYVERLVERAKRRDPAFVPWRLSERAPQPGDLICSSRDGGRTSLDWLDRGPGHCDIVVAVRQGSLEAIGGNVEDSVSLSTFPLDATGFLSPISGRPFFTVIENRLP